MQEIIIPFPPQSDCFPSQAGWSIWEQTDLDRHLRSGFLDEATLLAECAWAERPIAGSEIHGMYGSGIYGSGVYMWDMCGGYCF